MENSDEFCAMKPSKIKTNTLYERRIAMMAALFSLTLFTANQYKWINVNNQIIFAPVLVIVFMVYGDRLLNLFVLKPLAFMFTVIESKNRA